MGDRRPGEARARPGQRGVPRAGDHLLKTRGVRGGQSAPQALGAKHGTRPYRPTYRVLRGDPAERATAREGMADLRKGGAAGHLVLLSQDEARFPMAPTLPAALG